MLRHLELPELADRVERALLATFRAGIKTPDIGGTAGTKAFAQAVVGAIGLVSASLPDSRSVQAPTFGITARGRRSFPGRGPGSPAAGRRPVHRRAPGG